jgi:hypothetical protein
MWRAARRPAPKARITVAPPVTIVQLQQVNLRTLMISGLTVNAAPIGR